MPLSVKTPAACKPRELENFKNLLEISEQEGGEDLAGRIAQAVWLAFHYDEKKELNAIAALKHPAEGYRKGVFHKAALPPELAASYPLEFDWLLILDEENGRRIASGLLGRLMQKAAGQGVFAVSRSSRNVLSLCLEKHGFLALGEPFSRRSHRFTYRVYLNPAPESARQDDQAS